MCLMPAITGAAIAQSTDVAVTDDAAGVVRGIEDLLAPPPEPVEIVWRVENPFRLFADSADSEMHRATWLDLPPEQRSANPVLSAERALAARHPGGWAEAVSQKICWDPEHNIYSCEKDKWDYISPREHIVLAELKGVPDAGSVTCQWLTAPSGRTGKRGEAIYQPCNEPIRLSIPFPEGAVIEVEIGGRKVAVARAKVSDLFIVGMGDSFASGEGNPDVPVRFSRERSADYSTNGTDSDLTGFPARVGAWSAIGDKAFIEENARWTDQACHRSLYSHQLRAALQLAIEDPHRAVTFVGLACSGAEITQGLFLRYKGNEWVPNPPEYSQISAAAEAQCGGRIAVAKELPEAYHMRGMVPELKGNLILRECPREKARKIDLLMVSIGGNDIGFARLVANAVLDDASVLKKLSGWFGGVYGTTEASQRIDNLDERYKALNRALHYILQIPWDEADRVLLTAYPPLALVGDGTQVCPDGRAGMEVVKDFSLSSARARAGVWVSDKLYRSMKAGARANKWSFVDEHRAEFLGRGICAGYAADALRSDDDLRMPRKIGDAWVPYNPADYRAYASRERWFRTPNDAFMTGNFHVSQSILRKVLNMEALSGFQLTLAATYSGAFHPTAEGQAAIADAVVARARAVLERYERRR
ncbi:MAG: hypothetical protein APF80_14630 [Alphaproteobacteria bacterium BRH_c36]|nr:MAG: hypothetical protein APF80_14630 [Alphaproteobacteria bacterium BRH_c36]